MNSEIENLAIKHKNFYIFDAFKVVCPDSVCFYSRNNVALYRDSFHYSNYGAREIIGPKLIKFIEKIKK